MRERRGGLVNSSSGLVLACERALARSARAHGAGTRQQVRAAARRFVRRHRRDETYLRWVLRGIGACSALAVALLGLSAAPASAEMAPFAERTGAADPFNGQQVGVDATPALGDLDGDGDLDCSRAQFNGDVQLSREHGRRDEPALYCEAHRRLQSARTATTSRSTSALALGDFDGHGRPRPHRRRRATAAFIYFKNTGSATSPSFAPLTGAANPLAGEDVGQPRPPPARTSTPTATSTS